MTVLTSSCNDLSRPEPSDPTSQHQISPRHRTEYHLEQAEGLSYEMANGYNLRSRDHEPSAYATLPGTATTEFIPHNMTRMKSNLVPGREIAGCHPSRWIYELINNDFTVCDLFIRARRAKLDSHYRWDHPHRLVINGNQAFSTPSTKVLSAVCLDCHFHFIFKVEWEEKQTGFLCHHRQSEWPIRDNQFPWHHLVWVGSDSDANITRDQSKYYPLLARENFVCSAPPCTFQITLEVSEPRMPSWWVELLLDHEAILQQLTLSREQEPSRYEGATNDWAHQAPHNLNTYLKNLLESSPDAVRSISKRNKRFAVLFGPRCFSIFRELEFKEEVDEHEGIDEGCFTPTAPPPPGGPSGSTEIGTYRGYLEDVRSEVQNLIFKSGNPVERPTFCTQALHSHLECAEVTDVRNNALVNVDRYRLLGVLPSQTREIVVNAYKRQWELIPNKRRDLVEGLMAIANDSGDDLLSDYAITQSSVFESQLQRHGNSDDDGVVSQALNFLALSPPNNYSAEAIVLAFRKKLANDAADASTARSMLLLIAEASTDDIYQTTLLMEADAKMSLETSKFILGIEKGEDSWQNTVEITKKKIAENPSSEARGLYLDALDSIAEHTASAPLKQAVMEIRHAQGISSSIVDSGPGDSKAVNLDLPVGLNNIGNTCYLNSLLQYLFTVKPIRDIVFNYDDLRLDLTDESIQARRLGGNKMQMDRGEAVVAQAFAQELATLFNNLRTTDKTATRPSQRLANAVLLSTHTLLTAPKQPSEAPSAPKPPPLPARPSPAPPSSAREDIDMINVSVKAIPDSFDTASNSSTQTLVEHDDAQSEPSYEKVPIMGDEAVNAPHTVSVVFDDTVMDDTHPNADGSGVTPAGPAQTAADSNEFHNADVDMLDAEEPETIDQKVLNALEHQKRSSGTDQQDVEEVMGSIINRLQAAIRPSHVDKTSGIQLEKIMETFFVTTINYTKKFDEKEYQHEVSFDRSITAFPAAEGPCSLYDALGRNFDQQILEDSKLSRYTAIKTLPPVLHILIQRSQSMGSKNGNPVVIPETLYLDRYMDAPHDSPTFRRRVEDWITTERISDLKSQLAKVDSNPTYLTFLENYGNESSPSEITPASSVAGESTFQGTPPAGNWDFDGPVEDDFVIVTPAPSGSTSTPSEPIPKLTGVQRTHTAVREMMERELKERMDTIETNLSSEKEISYRLHAVICHRGHLTSGHYWVWIHDFDANVWRWYNDADVKENKDTAEVLHTLSTSGEPYFLCYVRDEDKEEYVSVPHREVPKQEEVIEDMLEVMVEDKGEEAVEEKQEVTTLPTPPSSDKDDDLLVIDDELAEESKITVAAGGLQEENTLMPDTTTLQEQEEDKITSKTPE